jgi:hypothetical protein
MTNCPDNEGHDDEFIMECESNQAVVFGLKPQLFSVFFMP